MIPSREQKSLNLSVVKLLPIVQDQYSRYTIPTDDVSPYKASHILLRDGSQNFGFYPLGEVVYTNHQEF